MAERDITEDAILGGRVRVRQPARGYRVNVDTILLAAALPAAEIREGARVVELCCGVGAALLAVASHHQGDAEFIGLERDPVYAELARQNVELNGQAHRARIIETDALGPAADNGVFHCILLNPPYDTQGKGRAPREDKRGAYVADRPIEDWIKVWSSRMAGNASFTMIHRAHHLGEILGALEGRLGGIEVFPVRASANAPAQRVLVRAWKGSRAPLKLLAGLDLHPTDDANGKYTPEAEAILRGEAHITFG